MGSIQHSWDVRWTHLHLVLSLKKNMTTCHHGRCELLSNGSLRFSRVQTEDSGNYSVEVFHENGTRLMRTHFLLRVEAAGGSRTPNNHCIFYQYCSNNYYILLYILLILQ